MTKKKNHGKLQRSRRQLALRKSHASHARTRTGKWQSLFLRALATTPSVTFAAKKSGCARRTVYAWREQSAEFREKWDDALNQSVDNLEHHAYQQAIEGDAQLAMFFLKAHRPEVYRERSEVAVAGGVVFLPAKKEGAE